jgi:hypothetical protein
LRESIALGGWPARAATDMQDFLHLPISNSFNAVTHAGFWTPRDAIYESNDLPPRSMNGDFNWSMIVRCSARMFV